MPCRGKLQTDGHARAVRKSAREADDCHTIEAAGIYVLDVAGRFILKKAMIQSEGTLIIRSDSVDEYPDEERYDLRHMDDSIVVCGKVLAW